MKSKAFLVIWVVTVMVLSYASVGLLPAKRISVQPASASLSVPSTTSAATSSARNLAGQISLSVAASDHQSQPEPLLYLLVGAALIGISFGAKYIGRLRKNALRMGKLSEISDLEVLTLAPPKRAGSSAEHGSHRHNHLAR